MRIFDVTRPGRDCEVRPTCATKKSRDGQRGIISCLAFAPDGSGLYAAGSFSGTTGLYVENQPGLVSLLGGHRGGVTQASFSHDGVLLLTAARRDDDIVCWDVRRTGDEVTTSLSFEVAVSLSCEVAASLGCDDDEVTAMRVVTTMSELRCRRASCDADGRTAMPTDKLRYRLSGCDASRDADE